ncbi:MAG TPA: UpxY family transcription antiterminator [Candidatus Dormibacteraeota bacterium]|nr:UpxY family transcription antiterminator [Candidatus Dormibacteraeota bacterium]
MNIARNVIDEVMQAGWLEPKWYVLYVRSNQEKHVAQHLKDREVEHYLPTFESVRQWRDRKVKLLSPLFPGYVFIRLALTERLKALAVPNVVSLVGTRNNPSVISDAEMEWVQRGMEHGKAEPHPYLTVGARVVIKAGPMAGMEGILVRMQNSTRVLVGLNSISRAFAVEVDGDWVECVTPKAGPSACLLAEGRECDSYLEQLSDEHLKKGQYMDRYQLPA